MAAIDDIEVFVSDDLPPFNPANAQYIRARNLNKNRKIVMTVEAQSFTPRDYLNPETLQLSSLFPMTFEHIVSAGATTTIGTTAFWQDGIVSVNSSVVGAEYTTSAPSPGIQIPWRRFIAFSRTFYPPTGLWNWRVHNRHPMLNFMLDWHTVNEPGSWGPGIVPPNRSMLAAETSEHGQFAFLPKTHFIDSRLLSERASSSKMTIENSDQLADLSESFDD